MSWKKKIIAATIVLAAVMANFGCESGSNSRTPEVETGLSTVKADTITPEAQEINMPFNLEYNEHGVALNERVLGYADEEKMLIINSYKYMVNIPGDSPPEYATKGMYMVYFDGKTPCQKYDIKSDMYIYSAVPYKDGIIYIRNDFLNEDDFAAGHDMGYRWNVIYSDVDGTNVKRIDSGYSETTSAEIILLEDTPVYVCEDFDGDKTDVLIKKIVDLKCETIAVMKNHENTSLFEKNKTEYFLNLYDFNEKAGVAVAGDLEGIKVSYPFKDVCNSVSISRDCIVGSFGGEMGNTNITCKSLEDEIEESIPQTKRWWRMTGASGRYCVMVDDGFNPYYFDTDNLEVGKIDIGGLQTEPFAPKMFYPAGKDRFVLELSVDNKEGLNDTCYYIVDMENNG